MKKGDIQVLIVDDDKAIGKTLSEAVTRAGFKATVCVRADDALNQARLKNYHAAIIDCMLPAMNGLNFTEALRKSRFAEGVVVLISGIFRDKAFESEALKKTKAIGFLQKPFGPNDLMSLLKPKLDALVDDQQWNLQTILTKKMDSTRDRMKVVERLEEIKGIEFAFVLSILADAKVSGDLNLVSKNGDIFGIKLRQGLINSIDSDTADEVSLRYLMDTGYLTKDDLRDFETTEVKKTGPVARLVQLGTISPHAGEEAYRDQIIHDLKRILKFETVNISFSPEETQESSGLELTELFLELNDTIDSLLTAAYLKQFFVEMMTSSIQRLAAFNLENPVWKFPIVKRCANISEVGGSEATLTGLVEKDGTSDVLKAIYCLVIFRQILFIDAQLMKNLEQETNRRRKVLEEIDGKSPHQIFNYFGTSPEAKSQEVQRVFIEFVKANHPDRLTPDAPANLRSTTTALFSKVSEAYEILTNPEKLQEYQNQVTAKETEKVIQAEALQKEGFDLIRRGSYAKAEEKINASIALSASRHSTCLQIWARLKQTGRPVSPAQLAEFRKALDAFTVEERHDPHFHMAFGLVRMAMGEANAVQSFEKAVALNVQFVEARREINSIQGKERESKSASDLLTGDLTSIVSQIFKRKAK